MKKKIKLAQDRINKIESLVENTKIRTGWINYMRLVFGMRLEDLAKRLGLATSTISDTEKRETKGRVSLETLEKVADALECDLVYAFVPRKKIQSIIFENAKYKAINILKRADTHMSLEDQAVSSDFNERVDELAEKLIKQGKVW